VVVKKTAVILTSVALLLPITATGDVTVKFFPGWSFRHQDDEIHDGATLWAIIKQGDAYVLTERTIRLKSFHSPIRDDEGQESGRELIAADREASIIHFTGIDNLKSGPIFLSEIEKPLVNTFNPKIPPSSVDFEIQGKVYTVFVQLSEQNDMSIYMEHGGKQQLLCKYPNVADALSSLQWVADIDRDDAPDLLISASGHYSHVDHRLYLSSVADPGSFVKEVGRYTDGD
jgi:hypothetical protein